MTYGVARTAEPVEILDTAHPGPRQPKARLSGRQKAAIIVRVLLADGAQVPLSSLPEHVQAALTEQIGSMRLVDRTTLRSVVEEFIEELEEAGVAFPGGIDGAISMLDGHISATAANRLRRLAGVSAKTDPWERICAVPVDRLLPVLELESVEVGAVMLSKLNATTSAGLLEKLSDEKARLVANAMARTGRIDPETVRRIGMALHAQLESQPRQAFEDGPDERMGAILNSSPAAMREAVLASLAESDPDFAEKVRRAIFTFANIHARLSFRDVPKVVRQVDPPILLRALKAASAGSQDERAAAEFLLTHLPQRMAENLREEVAEHASVTEREGESAMAAIVTIVRAMETRGEVTLVTTDVVADHGTPNVQDGDAV